jgi:hypothetical protein
MQGFFTALIHIIIVGGLVTKLIIIFNVVFGAERHFERVVRASALTTGAMIFFGSRALGISMAELVVRSIRDYKPLSFGLANVVLPGTAGLVATSYFVHCLKRSSNVAIRIAILVGTWSVLQFGEVYMAALSTQGIEIGKANVANLMFTLSVSLYLILKYDPDRHYGI